MPTPFLLNGILASQISGHLYSGPTGAFDALGSVTVGAGGQSSITFSAIPQTYTHLQVRWIAVSGSSGTDVKINFNSDSTNYYSWHELYGDGSSANAAANTSQTTTFVGITGGTSNPSAGVFDILDYASTNKNKTLRALTGVDNNGSGYIMLKSGSYFPSTITGINSMTIAPTSSSFNQYTQFALYGIR